MDCNRQLLKILIGLHLSSSLHVNIIIIILLFYIHMAWK